MGLSGYQEFVYSIEFFRNWGLKYSEKHPEYNLMLEKANFNIRTEIYVATALMNSILASLGWLLLALGRLKANSAKRRVDRWATEWIG